MKSFITKILSFFLALAILITTSSFTVDMHFCCNKLVDISVLGAANVCKNEVQKKESTTKQCSSIQEKDCCSNQTFSKKGDNTFKKPSNILEIETLVFLNTYFSSYILLFKRLDKKVFPFKLYRSPLISKDIQILNETFLIWFLLKRAIWT